MASNQPSWSPNETLYGVTLRSPFSMFCSAPWLRPPRSLHLVGSFGLPPATAGGEEAPELQLRLFSYIKQSFNKDCVVDEDNSLSDEINGQSPVRYPAGGMPKERHPVGWFRYQ
jgi:hypothetical protein